MEDSTFAKAIHEAIDKIRTKDRQRPHVGNIIKVAANQSGLAPDQIQKHLSLLVTNGVVYIERTSKGEDSYYFDADKLTRNDGISSEIDSSSDDNSGLEKILTSEDIQRAAENDTPDMTPNLSERFEFMQFLHLVEKLTNDNRDLQTKISNGQDEIEKLISENCESKLENYQLKLDVNENPPREVSVSTQTIVISEDCDPNKNASSQLLNNAGIVTGNENSKNQQAMQMKKKRPNKKQRARSPRRV